MIKRLFNKKKLKELDKFIIFDLEYTAWESSLKNKWSNPGEYREIIEIGAVFSSKKKNFNVIKEFNVLVLPSINYDLSDYITKLTGIRNEDLKKKGISFGLAYTQFIKFIKKHSRCVFAYGDDVKVLKENIKINKLPDNFEDRLFHNIRPIIESELSIKKDTIDSSQLNKYLGIKDNLRYHRALNDCKKILNVIKYLNDH